MIAESDNLWKKESQVVESRVTWGRVTWGIKSYEVPFELRLNDEKGKPSCNDLGEELQKNKFKSPHQVWPDKGIEEDKCGSQ